MDALAELGIYHSRPFAPTRRLALADSHLPTDPAPGPGGVLLGGIVAHHRNELDEDLFQSMMKLTLQLQEGQRIVQPRLRHRFQDDRHGLTRSSAQLRRDDGTLAISFDNKGTGLQLMLGAVYTAGALAPDVRRTVMDAVRKGLRWNGPLDRSLYAHLSGLDNGREWSPDVYEDPVRWAMQTLGLNGRSGDGDLPDRKIVQRSFRDALRDAHPDHGGATDDAARRITDLTEAREDPAVMSPRKPARKAVAAEGLVVTPGASADRDNRTLVALDEGLPLPVERITIRSRAVRKVHDQLRSDMEDFADRLGVGTEQLLIGGRSFGGRMCSMLAAAGEPVAGLVLLSYPLHPPGKPTELRVDHFADIAVPTLFVSGTKDPFASPEELEAQAEAIRGPVTFVWLEGEPHSPRDDAAVVAAVAGWLDPTTTTTTSRGKGKA